MAFDGDDAGLRAANKGAKLALGMEMEIKLVEIPRGSEPADLILKDKLALVEAMKNTVHIIIFNLNVLLKKETDKKLRERIPIKDSENIIMFIGVGEIPESINVAVSTKHDFKRIVNYV